MEITKDVLTFLDRMNVKKVEKTQDGSWTITERYGAVTTGFTLPSDDEED